MNIEIAKKNLLETKEILDDIRIKFWLVYGTLLGAIRERNFISYDTDIDLMMKFEDYNSLIYLKFKTTNFQYTELRYQNKLASISLRRQGIKIDILPLYYYPPENHYVVFWNLHPQKNIDLFLARFFKGDHFTEFLGERFRVPDSPKELLEQLYGKSWKIPLENGGFEKGELITLDKYHKYFKVKCGEVR